MAVHNDWTNLDNTEWISHVYMDDNFHNRIDFVGNKEGLIIDTSDNPKAKLSEKAVHEITRTLSRYLYWRKSAFPSEEKQG